jgi:hypothetical protein
LHCAIASTGFLSSLAPDPTTFAEELPDLFCDDGATAVPGAGTIEPVLAEFVVAALTPP